MSELRSADLRKIVRLCGEVGELSTPESRIEHLLQGTMELTGTDVLGMVALNREQDYLRLGSAYVLGISESQARFMNDWYLEGGAFKVDPFNRAIAKRGEVTVRRQDMLSNSEWYADPHIEGLKSLTLDGVLASIRNLRKQMVTLVARREWGSSAYTDRDREKLDYIADCFKWFFLDLERDHYFAETLRVPSRCERVMDGLMKGLSEKEIAAELHLSSRTVHKYVQEILRRFGVNSRPKLMALWTSYPRRGDLPPSIYKSFK